MSKHTPGPWSFETYSAKGLADVWSGNTFIAETAGPESEANARLIAAAPQLLKELKYLIKRCQGCGYFADGHGGWYGLEDAFKAIAEAEGTDSHG